MILLSLAVMACGDDDIPVEEVRGTVVLGTGARTNCGFLVSIDGLFYKPTYLNAQYEQDGFNVLMKVEFMDELSDCAPTTIPTRLIRIEQIRPAN